MESRRKEGGGGKRRERGCSSHVFRVVDVDGEEMVIRRRGWKDGPPGNPPLTSQRVQEKSDVWSGGATGRLQPPTD